MDTNLDQDDGSSSDLDISNDINGCLKSLDADIDGPSNNENDNDGSGSDGSSSSSSSSTSSRSESSSSSSSKSSKTSSSHKKSTEKPTEPKFSLASLSNVIATTDRVLYPARFHKKPPMVLENRPHKSSQHRSRSRSRGPRSARESGYRTDGSIISDNMKRRKSRAPSAPRSSVAAVDIDLDLMGLQLSTEPSTSVKLTKKNVSLMARKNDTNNNNNNNGNTISNSKMRPMNLELNRRLLEHKMNLNGRTTSFSSASCKLGFGLKSSQSFQELTATSKVMAPTWMAEDKNSHKPVKYAKSLSKIVMKSRRPSVASRAGSVRSATSTISRMRRAPTPASIKNNEYVNAQVLEITAALAKCSISSSKPSKTSKSSKSHKNIQNSNNNNNNVTKKKKTASKRRSKKMDDNYSDTVPVAEDHKLPLKKRHYLITEEKSANVKRKRSKKTAPPGIFEPTQQHDDVPSLEVFTNIMNNIAQDTKPLSKSVVDNILTKMEPAAPKRKRRRANRTGFPTPKRPKKKIPNDNASDTSSVVKKRKRKRKSENIDEEHEIRMLTARQLLLKQQKEIELSNQESKQEMRNIRSRAKSVCHIPEPEEQLPVVKRKRRQTIFIDIKDDTKEVQHLDLLVSNDIQSLKNKKEPKSSVNDSKALTKPTIATSKDVTKSTTVAEKDNTKKSEKDVKKSEKKDSLKKLVEKDVPRKQPEKEANQSEKDLKTEVPLKKKRRQTIHVDVHPSTTSIQIPNTSKKPRNEINKKPVEFSKLKSDSYVKLIPKNVYSGDTQKRALIPSLKGTRCRCSPNPCGESCLNRSMFIECDVTICGKNCTNSVIQTGGLLDKYVEKFQTEQKGYGVRTKKDIPKKTLILEYTGEVLFKEAFRQRMQTIYKNDQHHYCLELNNGLVLDGHRMGSLCRFVNHSCKPNCGMAKIYVDGLPRMILQAEDDIKAGTELTYDYKFDNFEDMTPQQCFCGAETCRGTLSANLKTPRRMSMSYKVCKLFQLLFIKGINSVIFIFQNQQEGETIKRVGRKTKTSASPKANSCFLMRNLKKIERHHPELMAYYQNMKNRVEDDPKIGFSFVSKTHENSPTNPEFVNNARIEESPAKENVDPIVDTPVVVNRPLSEQSQILWQMCEKLETSFTNQLKDIAIPATPKFGHSNHDRISLPVTFDDIKQNVKMGHYDLNPLLFNYHVKIMLDNVVKFWGVNCRQFHTMIEVRDGYKNIRAEMIEEIRRIWEDEFLVNAMMDKIIKKPAKNRKKVVERNDDEDIVNCHCGRYLEEGLMIQCQKCLTWQHVDCAGTDGKADDYSCVKCEPRSVEMEIIKKGETTADNHQCYLTLMRGDLQVFIFGSV